MRKRIAIVILTHKNKLTECERISLSQALKIFEYYDKFLVIPESLEYAYKSDALTEMRLEDKWFKNIHSYNALMTEINFYRRFSEYEYVLIYQLDTFVFSDKLKYFCDMGYDYIGAPWIDGSFYYKDPNRMIWYVGNGGLSLRKVGGFLEVLETNQNLLINNQLPEDLFFSVLDSESFRVAPQNIALEFAFEMKVRECYAENGNKLPFGCHAWHRFDLAFWKPFIESYGYVVPEKLMKEGQEDDTYLVAERRKVITDFWRKEYEEENLRLQIKGLFYDTNKKYAIWGAGYWGQMLCRMLEDAGIRIQVFIDRKRFEEPLMGHDVILPESLVSRAEKYNVIVAITKGYETIADYLNEIGYQYRKDYVFFKDIEIIYENVLI